MTLRLPLLTLCVVEGEIHGLKTNSQHGFHVHEKGDCSSGDGMSADATGAR